MLQPHSYQPPEDGLPPQEVHVIELRAEPWPDDFHRVRIHLEVTPFLERPDLEVVIADHLNDEEVSSINIVESIDAKMTFTMHIRHETLADSYALKVSISYPDIGIVDRKKILFRTTMEENKSEDS